MTKPPPDNLINLVLKEWNKMVIPVAKHLVKCEIRFIVNVSKAWGTFLKEVASYRREEDDE